MGNYVKVRGWIDLDKVFLKRYSADYKGPKISFDDIKDFVSILEEKYDLLKFSSFHVGTDGDIFLFIGGSTKNYSSQAENFIKDVIKKFPDCDGMILFNEKELEVEPCEKVWIIKNGEVSESRTDYGYGFYH